MSAKEKAPILPLNKQKHTQGNKKRPLKHLKNVLTSNRALHWPIINDESEATEIDKLLKLFFNNKQKGKLADDEKKAFKAKLRVSMKFGVNEISRMINNNTCKAVILDANVPSVLVMHILTTSVLKKIPLICIPNLSKTIREYSGFQSSSICFIDSNKISELIKVLCFKYFKHIYSCESIQDDALEEVIVKEKIVVTSKVDKNEDEFIKFAEDPKYLKRAPKFQHLIIKRMCKNENRC